MSKITEAVNWILGIAVDDSHGYQWGGWGPEYDCGHLVIMAWENAGVHVRAAGASYTGDMRPSFLRCGFEDVIDQVNVNTGAGLQIGDVLVNQANHAAMYVGNGRIVQARTNLDGVAGDSSGQEIRSQGYYNYSPGGWDCVLRYKGDTPSQSTAGTSTPIQVPTVQAGKPVLRRGMTGSTVKKLQELLIQAGEDCGPDGADGKFGKNTYAAVVSFQEKHKLKADGVADALTWDALEKAVTSAASKPATQTPAQTSTQTAAHELSPDGYELYTVKRGDSLWSIAGRQLGHFLLWKEIKELNGLSSTTIRPGQQLKLPKKKEK